MEKIEKKGVSNTPLNFNNIVNSFFASYSTLTEYNMFKLLGADAIGMSTVPEVIVAKYMDMDIFAMSCISMWLKKQLN